MEASFLVTLCSQLGAGAAPSWPRGPDGLGRIQPGAPPLGARRRQAGVGGEGLGGLRQHPLQRRAAEHEQPGPPDRRQQGGVGRQDGVLPGVLGVALAGGGGSIWPDFGFLSVKSEI